ncbi:MAG TPA: helix-turn-helix transcriptional regulator [Pyrinomonadaceae bacterium]|jgi:transcriptional regulator with XRE-family HTH domain
MTKRKPRPKPSRLAEKIKQIRKEVFNCSQNELIVRLGYEKDELIRETVSSYERGWREPPLQFLLRLARAANVTLESVIDDELQLEIIEKDNKR